MIKQLLRGLSLWEVCASHCKPLSYFCAVEKVLVCVNCVESKEHRGHRVELLKDAAEEYKGHLLSIVGILTNRRKKILTDKLEVEKKTQDLSKKVQEEKRKMLAGFQSLHQFLLDQEELLLTRIQEVEEEIVDKRNEHVAKAFRGVSSIDSKVRVLERTCQLPVDELMQDAGRILERCGELLKRLDAFLPEPEWRIPDLCALNVHLAGAMKQFRGLGKPIPCQAVHVVGGMKDIVSPVDRIASLLLSEQEAPFQMSLPQPMSSLANPDTLS
ncbi:UNVERIFIED_CONTAM: hypothetical protein K2H54_060781 [Gekko kuhli]